MPQRQLSVVRKVRGPLIIGASLAALFALTSAQAGSPKVVSGSLGPSKGLFSPSLTPKLKDISAQSTTLMSESDRTAFKSAFDAASRHDWSRAQMIAQQIHHKVAAKIIDWAYLTADETDPSFDELVHFIDTSPTWPLQDVLSEKAEKALPDGMPPARVIAWFAGQEPLTGEGMLKLGEAQLATNEKEYGKRWIALAWSEHDFTDQQQRDIYDAYKDILQGQPTIDRVLHLLWSNQYTQAESLLSEVPDDTQRLARARIALMKQSSEALPMAKGLPELQASDAGVLFDEARYLRRAGRDDEARTVLLSLREPDKAPYPEKWWVERNYEAREALSTSQFDQAYQLLANSGLTTGQSFADAEWMAGWVALRYLKKPDLALGHFQKLESGVTYPISLARAHYWAGRAAEAMGDTAVAAKAYSAAAEFPYTFYGQLGAGSPLLSNQKLTLPQTPRITPDAWNSFIGGDLVTAVRLLNEIDEDRYMRTFAYQLADTAATPDDLAMTAELFRQVGQTAISVRVAKRASQQRTLLTEYLYPLLDMPRFAGSGDPPEPAFILGLARQESEFNPRAVSSAGAMGIMQLLPSTARLTAKKNGLTYRSNGSLVNDANYNLQLGMAHVSDLLERYDGSYLLVAAAYNAGPNNVDAWIAQSGDPRQKDVDPVDWIETIPFTETRNYVQRVLENALVYRQRLAGRPVAFTLAEDLRRTSATPVDLSYLRPPTDAEKAAAAEAPPASSVSTDEVSAPSPRERPSVPGAAPSESVPRPPPRPVPAAPAAASEPEGAVPDQGDVSQSEQPPVDTHWNIPATCAKFTVRPDGTGECVQ